MAKLSDPFRLLTNGRAATVDEDSDDALGQALAVLLTTRIGERILIPSYGTPDPTFRGVSPAEVAAAAAAFIPQVTIHDVTVESMDLTSQITVISYDRSTPGV